MKKIHFVIFHSEIQYRNQGWLGIKYLISVLKQSFDLEIKASTYSIIEIDKAKKEIFISYPDIIALPVFQNNLSVVRNFTDYIKGAVKDSVIFIGNVEATIRPEILLQKMKSVDIAIVGEGEHTIVELVDYISYKKKLENCKGICYRDGIHIKKTYPRPLECNLDIFPYPDRDILSSYTHHHTLIYDMLASRGCNSNCTFCASHSFRKQPGPQVRIRTLPNIIDEIQFLVKNYHAKYIAFIDDTFGDLLGNNESYFRSFLHELDRRKINVQFQFNLRSENINENTVQIFKKMLYKGLDSIFIGFETGNDDDLKLYGKRANLQINMQTVKLLNQNSIRYRIGFIMFNPYSTLDRLKKNLAFLRLCQNIFTPNLMTSQLNLLNGTALLTKVRKENLLIYNQDDNSFDSEYPYYFVDPRAETAFCYFQLLNDLKIDNIQLEILDSYFRNCKIYDHPIVRSKQFQELEQQFLTYIWWMKNTTIDYGYLVLEQIEDGYSKMNENILNSFHDLKQNIEFMSQKFTKKLNEWKYSPLVRNEA